MNEKLELKTVALFLLNVLREAKKQKRLAKKHFGMNSDLYDNACGQEIQAHNIYQAFWENIREQYKIPVFRTIQGIKSAKSLFGE